MNEAQKRYLLEIFEREAAVQLADMLSTSIGLSLMTANENGVKAATDYIVGVFKECFDCQHLQVIIMNDDEHGLLGYAMIFEVPFPETPRYLHKIHVLERFRGNGIGSLMMSTLTKDPRGISLLTRQENIQFYEKFGLKAFGLNKMPNSDKFQAVRGMYDGLILMADRKQKNGAPVFFLNDQDVMALTSALIKK